MCTLFGTTLHNASVCRNNMYTLYTLQVKASSLGMKKLILVNAVDKQYNQCFLTVSHKCRMLLHYYTAMVTDLLQRKWEAWDFTGFSIKRASKCCDAPLSLLCSVCKNTHCREKSQEGKIIQMHQTLLQTDWNVHFSHLLSQRVFTSHDRFWPHCLCLDHYIIQHKANIFSVFNF